MVVASSTSSGVETVGSKAIFALGRVSSFFSVTSPLKTLLFGLFKVRSPHSLIV